MDNSEENAPKLLVEPMTGREIEDLAELLAGWLVKNRIELLLAKINEVGEFHIHPGGGKPVVFRFLQPEDIQINPPLAGSSNEPLPVRAEFESAPTKKFTGELPAKGAS